MMLTFSITESFYIYCNRFDNETPKSMGYLTHQYRTLNVQNPPSP